jgi:hypothetical protein
LFSIEIIGKIRVGILACAIAGPATAQVYEPPRLADGRPDLQGIWQVLNTANANLEDHAGRLGMPAGRSVVVDPADGRIPYLPAALARRQQNFERRDADDPMSSCYLAGVPRTMYLPFPIQILQTPAEVVLLSEYVHTWRWVPLMPLPRYPGYESWMGDPRGHWDGDTLVIETIGFNGETWLDGAGNYHSDALEVTERISRSGRDTLSYEATLEDPNVFSAPWTIRMELYRRRDMDRLLEYECYLYLEDAGIPAIGRHPEP